jgi:probable rRNA maturation factor
MIEIELSNHQDVYPVAEARLVAAVQRVLSGEGIRGGTVSLAIVDDATIHELNRRYLQHDEPTDVLSFLLERRPDYLEGEVILSADTADSSCARFGWTRDDELLLYAVHGALHLAGYEDGCPEDRQRMREREKHYLAGFGLDARYEENGREDPDTGQTAQRGEDAG